MAKTVQVAFISGPMYERLYDALEEFSAARHIQVEVGYSGDHPALNDHLASLKESTLRSGVHAYKICTLSDSFFWPHCKR